MWEEGCSGDAVRNQGGDLAKSHVEIYELDEHQQREDG